MVGAAEHCSAGAMDRRDNRGMRTSITIVLAMAAGFVGGVASHGWRGGEVHAQAPAPPPAEIRAQKFVVVDEQGVARGVFGIESNGSPVIEVKSEKGNVYIARWYPQRFGDFHEPPTTPRRITLLP